MEKDVFVIVLLDVYRNLLTPKQADVISLYYEEDLSLAEIAEHYAITRQAILDLIRRGEKQLYHYEERLGLAKRLMQQEKRLHRVLELAQEIVQVNSQHTHVSLDTVRLAREIVETVETLEVV